MQTHSQLLQLSTSLFLACALDSLQKAVNEGLGWDKGMERVGVVRHSTTLLLHLMKLLFIFQHVIEGKDLDDREEKVSGTNHTAPCKLTIVPFLERFSEENGNPVP